MARKDIPRRPELASSILVGGAVVYGFLCLPAIGQRGYPPIDPVWTGVTFLWIFPIAVSALFDSLWFRSRRVHLVIYALATAFIFSGTIVTVVPRMVNPLETLLGVVLFGPAHLVMGFCVEGVMQLLLWPTRRLVEPEASKEHDGIPRISLLTWMIAHSLICMTIGFPFAFRSLAFASLRARAVAKANADWADGQAVIYRDRSERGAENMVDYEVDLETGFEIEYGIDHLGFRAAYNQRIAQLVAERGLPAWSIKRFIPSEAKLRAMLDSTEMVEVTSFPYDVTANIALMRRGTLTRWGSTMSSGGDELSIVTKPGTIKGVGAGTAPVHVKLDGEVIYVRNGSDWLGAFHQNGTFLGSATREKTE